MAPVCPPEGRRAPQTPGAAGKSADQPVLTAGKGEYAMSLFGLRPEEPAAIRIREAATRGTLSHALPDERTWCRNGNRSSDLTRLPG